MKPHPRANQTGSTTVIAKKDTQTDKPIIGIYFIKETSWLRFEKEVFVLVTADEGARREEY